MADDASNTDPKPEGTPKADEGQTAPPWGDDFDPARAWKTIQTLREEVKGLKDERNTLKTSLTEKEDAEKSEAERLQARAEKAEADLKEARRQGLVSAAARKHNLPDDVLEFLSGDDEETINAKAERLAALGGGTSKIEDDGDGGGDGDGLPEKPKPALRPGHGGEGDAPFDPQAIAAEARDRF